MSDDSAAEAVRANDDVMDVLCRARRIDPTCQEASIRHYLREIAEAEAALKTIDIDDSTPGVSFSASWTKRADDGRNT